MQLKKLELQGFKSFADKTEIVFLDGITTIVGPNGSGKSNISDAVRWVLGEQSVKTLRGAKMEDVIFAGTEARKKVGFAEVSMYLDNSDESLPVEYKEVVVTRRVYRSGESNYLLNGSECRLKDIQELFMDTGVGKDGYSIISQGKIDEILSSKSEERRHIFEEASGIVKYRTRKEEAARKLENTSVTLARVTDVLTEIENVIGPLEKKAIVAKKYLELREKLKSYEVSIFVSAVDKNSKDVQSLDDVILTFSNDIQLQEKSAIELEKNKINLKERFQEITSKIEETQNKYYEVENENEKLNSKVNIAKASIESAKENIVRLSDEVKEDNEKIELLYEELGQKTKKKDSLSENKQKFETELLQKQNELNELTKSLNAKDLEITSFKENIEIKTDEKYELKNELSSIEATVEANEKQIDDRNKQNEKNIIQKDSVNAQKVDIFNELSKKNSEVEKMKANESIFSASLNEYANQINEYSVSEYKLKQEIMTLKSKYTYLTNLENENEGYYKSVKEALDYTKKNNISNVYGTVASVISTDEQYEYAIEIALGGYLQNIIVEDENQAKTVISYLKENSLGRVTFLPLNTVRDVSSDIGAKVRKLDGVIGMANELVKFDKKYSRAINLALNNTVIVDSVDNAIQISRKFKNQLKIVTLAGELFSSNGSITGGNTTHKSAGLIGRQEKIENLKKQIENKEIECGDVSKKIVEIKEKSDSIKDEFEKLKEIKDKLNIEIATFTQKYESIENELLKIENLKEGNDSVIEKLNLENCNFKDRINEIEKNILEIDEYVSSKQELVSEYARLNKEKSREVDILNEDIMNLKISLSSFDESVASIDEMREKITQDIDNFKIGIDRKNEQIENFNKNILNSENEIKDIENKQIEQVRFKDECFKLAEKLKDDKEECIKKQDMVEVEILKSIKKIEQIKAEKSKVESKKVKFDIEMENLKNKMWDDYELTVSSAKALLENLPPIPENMNINKEAENIRKEIKELGEVSVSSIEEYQKTKERYEFITSQKKDLEETKTKLLNLISNMTSIMKSQFEKQFKLITQNFNDTFKELFGGGKAELKLSDESNILESGIEIEVQPPGKKLQSMMLLSGGERALTATALLFAILKLKSPPFCILDEIEAALDDVNVHRFAQYIKKYSKNTQFIVITHRKGTMEVASSVYGVTMQEYGISNVISMKLK